MMISETDEEIELVTSYSKELAFIILACCTGLALFSDDELLISSSLLFWAKIFYM